MSFKFQSETLILSLKNGKGTQSKWINLLKKEKFPPQTNAHNQKREKYGVLQDYLVSSTELLMFIGHPKKFTGKRRELTKT